MIKEVCQGCGLLNYKKGFDYIGKYDCGHELCPNCVEQHDIGLCLVEFHGEADRSIPIVGKDSLNTISIKKAHVQAIPGILYRVEITKRKIGAREYETLEKFVIADGNLLYDRVLPDKFGIHNKPNGLPFTPFYTNN